MIFYIKLFLLAIKRLKSKKNYFFFQKFQAAKVVANLLIAAEDKQTHQKEIIDFGCGHGGYSISLSNYFKKVYAIDEFISLDRLKAFKDNKKIKFIKTKLLGLKLKKVDYIFCASVIEHIPPESYQIFFKILQNNLKKNGILYISFPPFLSPIGGHHVAPFHYFPEKIALGLTNIIKRRNIKSYEKMYGTWGLYRTKINEIEGLINKNGFKVIKIQSRFMPNILSKLIVRCDLLNWHCEIIAKKMM